MRLRNVTLLKCDLQVEALSDTTKLFSPLEILTPAAEADTTIPPFSTVTMPCDVTLVVHLDKERPLSEARWVKTGDIQEWLKSLLGRMFWVAGDAASGWEKKIDVVDPDPVCRLFYISSTWIPFLISFFRLRRSGLC
jgi:20S proteasome subunit alpha 6